MKYKTYGHRHVEKEIPSSLRAEVEEVVKSCHVQVRRGSAANLRDDILNSLSKIGWSPEVMIDPGSKISITSVKAQIGLCLQTGNMSRMYADLLKIQTLYLRETVRAGIIIVPGQNAAKEMGDNLANFERLARELPIFERTITVPVLVVGIEI